MGCFPSKPGREAFREGNAAYSAYNESKNLEHLKRCVSFYNEALQSYPASHPKHALMHSTIANAKFILALEQGPTYGEMSAAIESGKIAYQWYGKQTPRTSDFYTSALMLGKFYRHRFELEYHRQDGQDAIDCHLQAQPNTTSPSSNPLFEREALIELGISEWKFCEIRSRTQGTVSADLLNSAIKHLEQACDPARGKPDARPLQNLGHAYAVRYRLTGSSTRGDINRAIDYYEQALEAAQNSTDVRVALARALLVRNDGSGGDAREAIAHVETALERKNRTAGTTFNAYQTLGLIYKTEYDRTHALDDLQKSAEAFQNALNTTPDDQETVFNLAVLRYAIIEHQGDDASPEQVKEAQVALSNAIGKCAQNRQKLPKLREMQSSLNVPQRRGSTPARANSLRHVRSPAAALRESHKDVDDEEFGTLKEEPEGL